MAEREKEGRKKRKAEEERQEHSLDNRVLTENKERNQRGVSNRELNRGENRTMDREDETA